jgi:oligopeptide transport system substrate-binding protein
MTPWLGKAKVASRRMPQPISPGGTMNRSTRLIAAASISLLTISACSSNNNEGGGGGGGEGGTAVAYLAEPGTLDPTLSSQVTENEVLQRVFDPLIHYHPETADIELTGAAESYEVAEDGLSITFQLREATFHNGEPVNAEAFIRGLTRTAAKATASPVAYHLDGIKGFAEMQSGKATEFEGVRQGENELELVLEFENPTPEFIIKTGHMIFSPIPEAAEEDYTAFAEEPIGNGPYMMDGPWQRNVGINVEKYPDYNGPLAGNLDRIEWRIYSTLEGGYLDFEGGDIDATSVPPEQYAAADETYGDAFLDVELALSTFLSFHPVEEGTPGVGDVHFRRAISMALDREAINQAVFNGTRTAADSFIPPANTGYNEGACTYCVFDLEAAKAELEQADVPANYVLQLTFNSGAGHEDWVAAAAAQIEENLGIKTKVVPGSENFDDYLKSIKNITGVYRYGWGQDYPSPENWLAPFFQTGAGDNYSEYSNPEFDAKIDEARQTLDEEERLALYSEAEQIIVNDMPGMPMFYSRGAYVYNTEKFSSFELDLQLGNPNWETVVAA